MLKSRELILRKKKQTITAEPPRPLAAKKLGYDVSVHNPVQTLEEDSGGGTKYTLLGRGKENPRNTPCVCFSEI